jgi:aerobic C4-dicarboxylate transport protein
MESVRALPLGGLGLLFGIDRLMATATALTNMIGNTVAVLALAKWEGAFDIDTFRAYQASGSELLVKTASKPVHEPRADDADTEPARRAPALASNRSSTN